MAPEHKPSPELVAELMRELLPQPEPLAEPEPPPPSPAPQWDLEWPLEGSIAFRLMPPEEQWACRQARMPKERYDRAINSVIEQSLAAREADRHHHRALDPFGFGHWGRFDD